MSTRVMRRALLAGALFIAAVSAQSDCGTISGTVVDPSAAAVPGAKVVIQNRATNVANTTVPSEVGVYAAVNLLPGEYSVRPDITLEVGQTQQTVEVNADALALQTDTAASATTVNNKLVSELPTVVVGAMRSPFDLAILTPESKNFGDNNFQMGGGQAASYGVTLDGVSANTTRALTNSWVAVNTPSLEALTEFSVETNGFKAEYGHAGGGAMTFVSKSGTKQLHGSAYEFHSGHSSYHAGIIKFDKRFSEGLTLTTSYVFSKLLTDADTYWITDNPRAADHYNRRLEKSIGSYDVTHNFKIAGTYDLPFGRGKKYMQSGFASWVLGNWRVAMIGTYSVGRPVGLSTSVTTPLFAGRGVPWVTTYDNWSGTVKGDKFDPNIDSFFQPAAYFGAQPANTIGNQTRLNPKQREFPSYNENISVSKIIPIKERMRFELRGEAFNAFNRVRMGVGNTNVTSATFGKVTGTYNGARQIQVGAKFEF